MNLFVFFFIYAMYPPVCLCMSRISRSGSPITITSNHTLASKDFELGFFSQKTNQYFLGIWYKKITQRTYIWVANVDSPLFNSSGTLKFAENNLVLLNQRRNQIWSTNTEAGAAETVVAELLDDGNFVLKDMDNNIVWQSFDYPSDTLVPGMDLKAGEPWTSWKTPDDPSRGSFYLRMISENEVVVSHGLHRAYRFSPDVEWLYLASSDAYQLKRLGTYTRVKLSFNGILQLFIWNDISRTWNISSYSPKEKCDIYNICGRNGICDSLTSQCHCLEGFRHVNNSKKVPTIIGAHEESPGCLRKSNMTCASDVFITLSNAVLPDTGYATVIHGGGVSQCRKSCLNICSCIAFVAMPGLLGNKPTCLIWDESYLYDVKTYAEDGAGHDLYVRVGPSKHIHLGKKRKTMAIITLIVSGIGLLILIPCIILRLRKRNGLARHIVNQEGMENVVISRRRRLSVEDDTELPLMAVETISVATNHFSDSNKIGTGGFGSVYKGRLVDGQEIAVKRLAKKSSQGTSEFLNEVKLISRLQHRNLVRLLGCCVDTREKMLVYEYLENGSVDTHIFNREQSLRPNWQRRFEILIGTARGLLYLHQDSRLRIIHRDMKWSNVLLDKDMTPKISDFGLARMDEAEANTLKIGGTLGYMPPEYASNGTITTKLDVYSFGVLILEIVTGKRNGMAADYNLTGDVWKKWEEGTVVEMIDPVIRDLHLPSSSSSSAPPPPTDERVVRCIQIGLVCVQDDHQIRPPMPYVLSLLENDNMVVPQPHQPGQSQDIQISLPVALV